MEYIWTMASWIDPTAINSMEQWVDDLTCEDD